MPENQIMLELILKSQLITPLLCNLSRLTRRFSATMIRMGDHVIRARQNLRPLEAVSP